VPDDAGLQQDSAAELITNPHMLPKLRSEALLDAVRHMEVCTLRIGSFLGIPCSGRIDPCHLPVHGKGMSTKVTDMAVVAGCRTCHDLLDWKNKNGERIRERYPLAYGQQLACALVETHQRLLLAEVINVKGSHFV
jgi:hypothetical protein